MLTKRSISNARFNIDMFLGTPALLELSRGFTAIRFVVVVIVFVTGVQMDLFVT